MKTNFILLVALCFVGCSSMKTSDRHPAAAVTTEQSRTNLKEMFRKKLFTLNRPLIAFHYEDGSLRSEPGSADNAKSHISEKANNFADLSRQDDEKVGPGLYLAIDPNQTRAYGGTFPQLYSVSISANAVMLNAMNRLSDDESQVVSDAMKAQACTNADMADQMVLDPARTIALFRYDRSSTCEEFIVSLLKELNVQGILYTYTATPQYPTNQKALSNCRANRTEALSLIDDSVIDHVSYFSNLISFDAAKEASDILSLDAATALSQSDSSSLAPKTLLLATPASSATFASWENQEVYKCGAQWAPESEK